MKRESDFRIWTINIGLLTIIVVIGITCKSCVESLYKVHSENRQYLNLDVSESKVSGDYLIFYIDSVLNRNDKVPDSIKELFFVNNIQKDLLPGERLIHFTGPPGEWYFIDLNLDPYLIKEIYIPESGQFIYDRSELTVGDVNRIKERFINNVIQPSVKFAQRAGIPDSVVYERVFR